MTPEDALISALSLLYRWAGSAGGWQSNRPSARTFRNEVPEPRALVTSASPSMFGFWKAAGEVWPKTREQRCWVHKTANVLAKLPKSQHPKANARCRRSGWLNGRLPEQGSRHAARVLRLPGRALGPTADLG